MIRLILGLNDLGGICILYFPSRIFTMHISLFLHIYTEAYIYMILYICGNSQAAYRQSDVDRVWVILLSHLEVIQPALFGQCECGCSGSATCTVWSRSVTAVRSFILVSAATGAPAPIPTAAATATTTVTLSPRVCIPNSHRISGLRISFDRI